MLGEAWAEGPELGLLLAILSTRARAAWAWYLGSMYLYSNIGLFFKGTALACSTTKVQSGKPKFCRMLLKSFFYKKNRITRRAYRALPIAMSEAQCWMTLVVCR